MLVPVSVDDPRLDLYRTLRHPHRELRRSKFVVEGHLLVERLLASDHQVESVLVSQRLSDTWMARLPAPVPLFVLANDQLSQLVGFEFHRGILACGIRRASVSWRSVAAVSGPNMVVVCPEVHDPENLGTILRSAAAFGASGVLVGPRCPDTLSRRVLRVSMGASLRMPVACVEEAELAIRALSREYGFATYAAVLDAAAESLDPTHRVSRVALVLGREDRGLPASLVQCCSHRITIPMAHGTDSLNVAMAATILMYELQRPASKPIDANSTSGPGAQGRNNARLEDST